MTNLKLWLLTAIIVIILGAVVGVSLGLRSESQQDKSLTIPNLPEAIETDSGLAQVADFCSLTKTGWQCYFDSGLPGLGPHLGKVSQGKLQQLCEQQGGQWSCTDICFPEDPRYCDFGPLPDTHTPCTDSSQCQGSCIVDQAYLNENFPNRDQPFFNTLTCPNGLCQGQCSDYAVRDCDWTEFSYHEVLNGEIIERSSIVCD